MFRVAPYPYRCRPPGMRRDEGLCSWWGDERRNNVNLPPVATALASLFVRIEEPWVISVRKYLAIATYVSVRRPEKTEGITFLTSRVSQRIPVCVGKTGESRGTD